MTDPVLCLDDETAALAFVKRAAPILINCGMSGASLSLLDALQSPTAFCNLATRKPELGALAAEWIAPYQCVGVPADPADPKTMRELVIRALATGTEDGTYDFGFRTYAENDTEHWNLAGTPLDGVPAFSLYIIREGERTYCCSMSASSYAYGVANVFCYGDQSDEPKVNDYGQSAIEAYMDAENPEQEGVDHTYFGYFGDRDALDKRETERGDVSERVSFDGSALEVDLGALGDHAGSPVDPDQNDAFADIETLGAAFAKVAADAAWEDAKEYFSGNAVHPRILFAA